MKQEQPVLEKISRVSNRFEKDMAFMKFRWIANVLIVLILVIALIISYSGKEYIIIDRTGNVYNSKKADRNDNELLLIDTDAHTRYFYSYVWTFDHNNIEQQQKQGVNLGGNAITDLYKNIQKSGLYNNVRVNGYYVESSVDSVYNFKVSGNTITTSVVGTMTLRNNAFIEVRKLNMDLQLQVVDRVLKRNPTGLSIEAISLTSNEVISQKSF